MVINTFFEQMYDMKTEFMTCIIQDYLIGCVAHFKIMLDEKKQ